MSKIKIEASEELFNNFEAVSRMVSNLKAIIQNDMEIDMKDLFEWNNRVSTAQKALKLLADDTLTHILKDKGPVK